MKANTGFSKLARVAAVASFGGLLLIAQRSAEEFVTPGFHRITASLVDQDSGEPLAARVSFTDAAGKYYPPLGHPWRIPAGPWGGDLALPNGENYAYVEGEFEVELPDGEIAVKAVHGLEYDVYESTVEIPIAGKDTLTIPLKRWSDIAQRGWMAGDTHIHFPNPRIAMTEMKAEGLNVYGVNYKDDLVRARRFLKDFGDPFEGVGADPEGRMALDWGVVAVPETFVIDGDGKVVLRYAGPITDVIMKERIRPALAKASAE